MNEFSRERIETVLLGTGYTLRRLADELPEGSALLTTTSEEKAEGWREQGFPAVVLEYRDAHAVEELFRSLPAARVLIDSVPPQFGDPDRDVLEGVRAVSAALQHARFERLLYLSTTGVFGVEDGSEVSEKTPPNPRTARSQARHDSEQLYRATGIDLTVLRLPAIYGPGRGIGMSLQAGTYHLVDNGERWSNRIQVRDLVEILARLVMGGAAAVPPLLCVGDNAPARAGDIVEWYCSRFALPRPQRISADEARKRGLDTLLSNQRISNKLVRETLGLSLRYPSYREGAGTEFEVE